MFTLWFTESHKEADSKVEKSTQTIRSLPALALLLVPLFVSQCIPLLAVRELTYRPSPKDPYELWRALVTDSGLLILCGSVNKIKITYRHCIAIQDHDLGHVAAGAVYSPWVGM